MEWLRSMVKINGFSMVLRTGNYRFQWFTKVVHHWSNDGMVAYHRRSLSTQKKCSVRIRGGAKKGEKVNLDFKLTSKLTFKLTSKLTF